ncbi:Rmf/CrpP fold protein [Streptomyces sp. NRRL B-24484]|uniref:Rmf/CrpP fold protein n=1 Tax=Streptomyces sp. NRRL B-24484 TaxID=1463833 RepID=UPI000997CE17|nr:Rmf/CrpP fold protein [Streptomyces sp. NRRL B-24484]
MGFRGDAVRAAAAGRDAARAGQSVTVCPHPRESLLRLAWVRGYAAERPTFLLAEQNRWGPGDQ